MRRLAIIPARGNSKGIPNKNLQQIGGQSLVYRAVRVAQEAGIFSLVHVSTDSSQIVEHLQEEGFDVPFLRNHKTSTDEAPTSAVVDEVLKVLSNRGELFDSITVLEPTCPLRTIEDVCRTASAAEDDPFDAALSVSPVPSHYHASKQISITQDGTALQSSGGEPVTASLPRQLLEPTFIRNGAAYSVQVQAFQATRSLMGKRACGIVISRPVVNIDTPEDLAEAEKVYSSLGST